MGLDEFKDDSQPSSGREYYEITKSEFEDLLDRVFGPYDEEGFGWDYVGTGSGERSSFTGEIVYKADLSHDDLEMRIYSTIKKNTGKSRPNGEDAIRTVIWSKEHNRPIGGRKKTLRIQTWEKNLKEKLESLELEWDEVVTKCEECGDWMVERDGQYGAFLGCLSYPDCKNTADIED